MTSPRKCGRNRVAVQVIHTNQRGKSARLGYVFFLLLTDCALFSFSSTRYTHVIVTLLLMLKESTCKIKFFIRFLLLFQLCRHAAYQRGSQREGSPHYVFLYSEDESEDEGQALPLETRNRTQTFPRKVEVINVQVQSEDTLQALALRYRCTVSSTISKVKYLFRITKNSSIVDFRIEKDQQHTQRQ